MSQQVPVSFANVFLSPTEPVAVHATFTASMRNGVGKTFRWRTQIMPDFDARGLSDVERWVSFYEWFVDSVRDGYGMCIHEYTNDLSCRDQLERRRDTPEVRAVWPRVVATDVAFRSILLPTKRSIYGDSPESHFWFWGYPDDSPELKADLESMDAV